MTMDIINILHELLKYDPQHVGKIIDHLIILIAAIYLIPLSQSMTITDVVLVNFVLTMMSIFGFWFMCYLITAKLDWNPKHNFN